MAELRIQARKPRMMALENVCGAVTGCAGKDLEARLLAGPELGGRVAAMVVDAHDLVPQSRPRLFIVAIDGSLATLLHCSAGSPSPTWHPEAIIRAYNRLPASMKTGWVRWSPPMPIARLKTPGDIVETNPQGVDWPTDAQTQKLFLILNVGSSRKAKVRSKASAKARFSCLCRLRHAARFGRRERSHPSRQLGQHPKLFDIFESRECAKPRQLRQRRVVVGRPGKTGRQCQAFCTSL